MKYTVVIDRTLNDYVVYVPDLSECVARAGCGKEVLMETRKTITFHIKGMREGNESIP